MKKDDFSEIAVKYLAARCCTLMNLKRTGDDEWADVRESMGYLAKDVPSDASDNLKSKCAEMMVAEEAGDDDEDAEELCNCQFTLAYGKAKLRVPRVMFQAFVVSVCRLAYSLSSKLELSLSGAKRCNFGVKIEL